MMGAMFGYLLGGAVILEALFGFTGMGQYLVDSVTPKDFISARLRCSVGALSWSSSCSSICSTSSIRAGSPVPEWRQRDEHPHDARGGAEIRRAEEARGPAAGRRQPGGLALCLAPVVILLIIAIVGPLAAPTRRQGRRRPSNPPAARSGSVPTPPDWTFQPGPDPARLNVFIGAASTTAATVAGILVGLVIGMNEACRGPVGLIARGIARSLDLLQALPPSSSASSWSRSRFLDLRGDRRDQRDRDAPAGPSRPHRSARARRGLPRSSPIAGLSHRDEAPASCPTPAGPRWTTALPVGCAVILAAALGLLGVGVPPPTADGAEFFAQAPRTPRFAAESQATFPTLALIGCSRAAVGPGARRVRHVRRTSRSSPSCTEQAVCEAVFAPAGKQQ